MLFFRFEGYKVTFGNFTCHQLPFKTATESSADGETRDKRVRGVLDRVAKRPYAANPGLQRRNPSIVIVRRCEA